MKPCTDKPGLSLSVSKSSNNVKSTLDHGMLNPFKAIGIDEIKVINTPQNCSGCDHTDLQVILFVEVLGSFLLKNFNLAKIG